MLRSTTSTYVCWRCLSRRQSAPNALPRNPQRHAVRLVGHKGSGSLPRILQRGMATVQHSGEQRSPSNQSPEDIEIRAGSTRSDIRSRLRAWEAENPSPVPLVTRDSPQPNSPVNSMTANQNAHSFLLDVNVEDNDAQAFFDGDGVVDLRSATSGLQVGDLVEVSAASWRIQLFAICLGNYNGYDHFYTNTGKWFASHGFRTRFVLKNFVKDPSELQPLIDALPTTTGASEVLDQLMDLRAGISRDIGASLIRKMLEFEDAARHVHQSYVTKLNQAADILADEEEQLMSLSEITEELLPRSLKKNSETYPPAALYAVHTVLCLDDVAFRPVEASGRHQSYLFAVRSRSDIQDVKGMESLVRNFYEAPGGVSKKARGDHELRKTPFGGFILRAQKAIDNSRKRRKWSPHGMIGPSQKDTSPASPDWTDTDLFIVNFMQQWAAADKFSRASRFHWVGSAVLRAVSRYTDTEYLDSVVGWTFLQEIGWITPWDLHARHTLRLPGVQLDRRGGLSPWKQDSQQVKLEPDMLASLRRDFAGGTVYCIDWEGAEDIDDGISLEKGDREGEYWIHVHVADPASRIKPGSWLAERAARLSQTSYCTGHHERMFKDDLIRDAFSLAPNRPSLTFSAKVNEAGQVLDQKITPAVVRDVVYITPQAVSAVCGNQDIMSVENPRQDDFEVGTAPATTAEPDRKMTKPEELAEHQVADLKILSRLTKGIHGIRLQKGAMPIYPARPRAEVSLEPVQVTETAHGFLHCTGDPYIKVTYESGSGDNLVSSAMQLAGQVAAKWCHDRGIPIPYRVQTLAAQNADALRTYTKEHLYPAMLAGKRPSDEHLRIVRTLAGGHDISTTAGPNFTMGVDMYTKSTSPLRRYCDLLVHWQIEAALLEEARRGRPLAAASAESSEASFLPFSKAELDQRVIPLLRARERHAKLLDNLDGNTEWILQALVRAWKFGEQPGAAKLPETFKFTVDGTIDKVAVRGRIDWFDRSARIVPDGLNGVARMADMKPGDVYEVELADVNVYMKRILVKVLKKVE
ncbi:mitochondrial protein cyt-4 [Diplogelasinospora grovesii]|uniref:Mitochondrial protein cyt-4 n=1 Tax=Diplogelasinospora grovesii TaxID=303347 RepID=A0AAN6NHP6_9PEZI|nr:mitochondrial protein cyt-4 [Diplogelasinospora grovesii]